MLREDVDGLQKQGHDMIYRDIIDTLLDMGGQETGSDFETMIKRAVERFYRLILGSVDQDQERREFTLTTVASTPKYGLSLYVKRILNIEDATNVRSVTEMSAAEYDAMHPGTTVTGSPERYYPFGVFGVQTQPSAASVVSITSDVPGDSGGSRYVRVSGYNSAGTLITERVTLTGTSAISTTSSFSSIEQVNKSNDSTSTITGNLTVAAGSTTLAVIPVWAGAGNYLWIEFYPIPDSALSLTVRAIMRKLPLLYDEDWPQFDDDFHDLLVTGPGSELMPTVGKNSLAGKLNAQFDRNFERFKSAQGRRPNQIMTFQDVTTMAVPDDRPRIKGVDYL